MVRTRNKEYNNTQKHRVEKIKEEKRVEHVEQLPILNRNVFLYHGMQLIHACTTGDIENATKYITTGAVMVNDALIQACKFGHIDCVNLCINRGAHNLRLALEQSCYTKNYECASICVKNGARNCSVCNDTRH